MGSEVVGLAEIAERLGVGEDTVAEWERRGLLPEPAGSVGETPAWDWHGVEAWARETGRLEPDTRSSPD